MLRIGVKLVRSNQILSSNLKCPVAQKFQVANQKNIQQNSLSTGLYQQKLIQKFSNNNQQSSDEEVKSDVEEGKEMEGENLENSENLQEISEQKPERFMALTSQERIEAYKQDQMILNEKIPIRIFDTLQNFQKISNNKQIRGLGQVDQQRFLRSRISNLLKKEGEFTVQEIAYQIQEWVNDSFSKGQYQIIAEKDFKQMIFNPGYKSLIPLFYNSRFFQENPFLISNSEISAIVQRCTQNPELYYLLELVKYHRQFVDKAHIQSGKRPMKLQFNEQQTLVSFLQKTQSQILDQQNFDLLSLYYHFQALYSSNIMVNLNIDKFVKELGNIVFGNVWKQVEKDNFRNHLNELLFINFQASLNKSVKYFLCDIFFAQRNYHQSLSAISIVILIFERLACKNHQVSDLLYLFENSFGKQVYEFYMVEHLPNILQSFTNKDKFNLYNQGLKLYQQQQANNVQNFKFQKLTYFDEIFANQNKNYPNKIYYNYSEVQFSEIFTYEFNSKTESIKNIFSRVNRLVDQETSEKSSSERILDQYRAFIDGDKTSILQYLQQNLKFHGKLQILYNEETLEKNKDNEEFLNDLLVKSFTYINDYNQYENLNLFRFLERKDVPHHKQVKYQFSSFQKPDIFNPSLDLFKFKQQDQNLYEMKNVFAGNKIQFNFSTFGDKNKKPDILENDLDLSDASGKLNDGQNTISTTDVKINNNNNNNNNDNQGFSSFMQKTKEIDNSGTFVSKEDLGKIKNLQEKDGQRQRNPNAFAQIVTQKQRVEIVDEQEAANVERQLEQGYFKQFVQSQEDIKNLKHLQKHLIELPSTEVSSVLNSLLTQKFIEINGQQEEFNGEQIIYKLFNQPSLFQESQIKNPIELLSENERKRLVFYPNDGIIDLTQKLPESENLEKVQFNYQKYLDSTILPYQLPEKVVNQMLKNLNNVFSRKKFKRVLAHILQYNRDCKDYTLQLIAEIAQDQRCPIVLNEFAHLLIKNKIKISETGFRHIINGIYSYKSTSQSQIELVKLVFQYYNWHPKFSLLQPYIESLLKFNQGQEVFEIFQSFRKIIFSQKVPYNDSLSSDQNIQLQEQQKNQNRKQALYIYRECIQELNFRKNYEIAKLIYDDMVAQKYEQEEQDYINGIKAYQQQPEQLQEIYEQVKRTVNYDLTDLYIEAIYEVISANVEQYKEFFEQVQKDYIMNGKIQPSVKVINMAIGIYTKTKNYSHFAEFLKILIDSCYKTNHTTRNLCFQILNESTEDMSKGYLRALINDLFSPQQIEKIRLQQKEEAKDPKKMKEKQDLLQLKLKQQKKKEDFLQSIGKSTKRQQQQKQQQQQGVSSNQQQQQGQQQKKQQSQDGKNQQQQQNQQQQNINTSEIKSLEENVEEIQKKILEKKQGHQDIADQVQNIIGSKQKRKILKNNGYNKFNTTVEYLETGIEQ
ncbi:hypothetical protein PPERSA_10113 [Pseudocohnilembus persalinus]|uniref:Uncharacterized protein n=1 Tax=Pseudocohnilembus persalinus TaxID=266149 RepID=A0A0V0R9J8_PSEPJ|nr:hypothetical protein PPERSA_10113 [Pseudocohnilembus persalinus]|eukprot:KRX11181.1 hypothetical protein PPERSA_10113 [Pseudocohnilembus persalinus]